MIRISFSEVLELLAQLLILLFIMFPDIQVKVDFIHTGVWWLLFVKCQKIKKYVV